MRWWWIGGRRYRPASDYPCVDPAYDNPAVAHEAIGERVMADGRRLLEQPFVYVCAEGHHHASVKFDPFDARGR